MLTLAIRVGDDFGPDEIPENTDDEVDEAAENTDDEVDEAAEKTDDEVDEAAENTDDEVDEAAENTDDEVDETAENVLGEGMLSGGWKDTLRGGGMTIPSSEGGGPSSFSNTVYVTVAAPSSITAETSCTSIANWSKSTPH